MSDLVLSSEEEQAAEAGDWWRIPGKHRGPKMDEGFLREAISGGGTDFIFRETGNDDWCLAHQKMGEAAFVGARYATLKEAFSYCDAFLKRFHDRWREDDGGGTPDLGGS